MRLFIIRTTAFITIQVFVFIGLWFIGRPKPGTGDDDYLASLLDKHERLDSLKGPRIIFVGGSNLTFGIDSKDLEKELGSPTVNMGLQAGLGLDFILTDVESKISSNDLIVLSLEHEHFRQNLAAAPVLWRALELRPDQIKDLGVDMWPWLLDNGLYPIGRIARAPFTTRPSPKAPWSRDSLGERGDINYHRATMGKSFPLSSDRGWISQRAIHRAIRRIKLFEETANFHGAKVVCVYPYIPNTHIDALRPELDSIHQALLDAGIHVIGKPEQATLPVNQFYDTNYHLTNEGASIRSGVLARQLKSVIAGMKD